MHHDRHSTVTRWCTYEFETVQSIIFGILDCVLHQLDGLILIGCRMIRQTFQCHFLLGHQFAGILVHLCVVYAKATEYGKRLDNRYIRIGECGAIFLELSLREKNNSKTNVLE